MHATWKLIGIVVLGLLASIPSSGDQEPCEAQALDEFREQVKSGMDSSIPTFPSLQDCIPSEAQRNALADQLAETILAAKETGQSEKMEWVANVLKRVRKAFQEPGHRDDFDSLSSRVLTQVQDKLENLAVTPTTNQDADFGGLDSLIGALSQEVAADLPENPVPPPPNPEPPPPNSPEPPQDDNSWTYMAGVVILGIALMIFIYLALSRRRTKVAVFHDGTGMTQASDKPKQSDLGGPSGSAATTPLSADRDTLPLKSNRSIDPTQVSEVMNQLSEIKRQIDQGMTSSAQEEIIAGFKTLKKDHRAAIEGLAEDLKKLDTRLTVLQQGNGQTRLTQKALETKVDELFSVIQKLQVMTQELQQVPSPLEAQFNTEQALLKEDWKRFLNTEKEVGNLAQSTAAEGAHKIIFDELLRELPRAVESDPQLSQFFNSKLAPVHFINRQLKQIQLAGTRAKQDMPKDQDALMRKLLGLRDSAHLLATFRNTDKAGEELLRFKPAEWCSKKLPELADQFLSHYQKAQTLGQAGSLERARDVVVRALRIGELEPIDIVLGETDFNSEVHVGVSRDTRPQYPADTIVGVVKNGFRNIRDGRVLSQPEVIVNRL